MDRGVVGRKHGHLLCQGQVAENYDLLSINRNTFDRRVGSKDTLLFVYRAKCGTVLRMPVDRSGHLPRPFFGGLMDLGIFNGHSGIRKNVGLKALRRMREAILGFFFSSAILLLPVGPPWPTSYFKFTISLYPSPFPLFGIITRRRSVRIVSSLWFQARVSTYKMPRSFLLFDSRFSRISVSA